MAVYVVENIFYVIYYVIKLKKYIYIYFYMYSISLFLLLKKEKNEKNYSLNTIIEYLRVFKEVSLLKMNAL